jgi:hypothetical protein
MVPEVGNAAGKSKGRTACGRTTAAMCDNLATNATFLGGECEGGRGRSEKISGRGMKEVTPVDANEQLDVAQSEGGSVIAATGVFTRTEEKEECNDGHIHYCLHSGVSWVGRGDAKGVMDDADGDRFDAIGGGIIFGVGVQLTLEAEVDGTKRVLVEIAGPHAGERLPDRAKGVLHSARSDGPAAGRQPPIAVALGKDLEDRDGILEGSKGWIVAEVAGKCHPDCPMLIGSTGTARNNAGSDRCLNKAEINAEFIGAGRWQSSQEVGWG